MAERRPLTARDVKSNVEGYSEMSDEAFARRFYSDRAELTALGVPAPVAARRVHRRGAVHAPLGALLPRPARARRRRARRAPDRALLPRGEVRVRGAVPAGAPEPRSRAVGFAEPPTETAERVRVSAPDYSPELAGRLSKLESAISKQRTVRFDYWSPRRVRRGARVVNPYALRLDDGNWYVVGHDLDRDAVRTFKVSRITGDIRFATRRERDFRVPPEFDVEQHRIPRPWQIGETVGTARIAVSDDTAWWVERTLADAGSVEDGVFETEYAQVELLAGWVMRQNGRAVALEPDELRDAVAEGLTRLAESHSGEAPVPGRAQAERPAPAASGASSRPRRTGALRRPPGPSRAAARGLRGRADGRARRRRARRQGLDPARGAPGAPLAPQPRQLRRRLLRGLRRARRRRRARGQGALRRRVPPVRRS